MDYTLKETITSQKQGVKLILKQFLSQQWSLIIIVITLTIATVGSTITPMIIKYAIDTNIAQKDLSGLWMTSGIFAIAIVISFFARFIQMRTTGLMGQKILFNLRQRIFNKMQELPLKFFSQNQTGDIIQRLTGNVDSINSFFSEGIMRLLGVIFGLIAESLFMFYADFRLGGIVTAGGILIVIFLWVQGRFLEKALKKSLGLEGQLSAEIQESLNGFRSIKAYNQTDTFTALFDQRSTEFLKNSYSVSAISATSESFMNFISIAITAVVLLFSLVLYSRGEITQGTVILFLTYLTMYFRQLMGISDLWLNIQRGIASAERISELLHLKSEEPAKESTYNPKKDQVQGAVEFKHVDFSYGGKQRVLKDVSFSVDAGKSIAVIGPTGAGKTTFVNLIARLYDVDGGEILVDGVNVKGWNVDTLRSQIGYLIQDTFLFEDTILNNLRYNNEQVSEKQALDTFEYLGAADFIAALPEGLNTKLTSGGDNVSAGQRQLIALARVLLRDPRILILDEATSKIDTKSEKMIQSAIEKANKGRTSFIIAHRLSTIFNADIILLIQDNVILESGTHDELIAKKGVYYEMYSKFVGL